jgi:hypothetical protein
MSISSDVPSSCDASCPLAAVSTLPVLDAVVLDVSPQPLNNDIVIPNVNKIDITFFFIPLFLPYIFNL